MSDKQRQELVEKLARAFCVSRVSEYKPMINQMLAEYDKLKGDKWADMPETKRLKEFVKKRVNRGDILKTFSQEARDGLLNQQMEAKDILAEIEHLEQEEKK